MSAPADTEADLAVFRACGDPTRLRLLVLLCQRELCVCELVAALEMPQGKVSRHLAVLRQAGLVRDRRVGTWAHYSLVEPRTRLIELLHTYLRGEAKRNPVGAASLRRLRRLLAEGGACSPAGTCRPPRRRRG